MARLKHREDADLMPDLAAASIRGTNPWAFRTVIIIGLGILGFLFWASQTEIDEVTSGDGRVIPSRQNQIVQHLEGGIVREILVAEGDIVRPGQVLLRIENTEGEASYEEQRNRRLALLGRAARLQAQVDGLDEIQFSEAVLRQAPDVARQERQLFNTRRAQLESELSVLNLDLRQRQQALREQISTVNTLESTVASLREELSSAERLFEQGGVSRGELLRIRRQTRDKEGELRTERLKIPRARAAVRETERRIQEKRDEARSDALSELNETRTQISIVEQRLQNLFSRQSRTDIRSPVRGTISRLRVTTVGGVVREGEPLVEIVPLEDTLVIEARIRPSDRAFLRPGQEALVKITAYDFSDYGGLQGVVDDISADTIEDPNQRGERFYRVRVRTDRNYLTRDGERLPIIPGMTAQVEIRTGRKTVLDYIFKPLIKTTVDVDRST